MELKVFTLNCWGIPIVSKDRSFRMKEIATSLAVCDYDVVCLQEVWLNSDYDLIKEKIKSTLPYSHYFHSGVFGSGVCIFSKHQIINTHFHKWMINGYIHKLHHGDWFGGKGIGMVQIKFKGIIVNMYSTHLHAEYDRDNDEYYACRVVQAYDTAQFINLTSNSGDVVILAGDLNCEQQDLTYKFMVEMTNFTDAFLNQQEERRACTNFCLHNCYTPKQNKEKNIDGPRIDYILYKTTERTNMKLIDYTLPLSAPIPGSSINYSDHEALATTFLISKQDQNTTKEYAEKASILREGIKVMSEGIENVSKHRKYYWMMTVVLLALIIATYFCNTDYIGIIYVLRFLLNIATVYTFIMATIWNRIETNTLVSMKLSMETHLKGVE